MSLKALYCITYTNYLSVVCRPVLSEGVSKSIVLYCITYTNYLSVVCRPVLSESVSKSIVLYYIH